MHIELNNINLFYCSIIGGELKYTRKVGDKLYTLAMHVEDKIDAFNKLQSISKTPNDWFIELSELANRVAKSESSPEAIEIVS